MSGYQGFSDSDDDDEPEQTTEGITPTGQELASNINYTNTQTHLSNEVTRIFQQNIKENVNQMTLLQIRRTVRDKIFPFMKFTNEYVLRQMKLREENNLVHILLQDLNRLDDDDINRAKFWLSYKNEIKNVLTTRKTEVSNQMKKMVLSRK